MGIVRLHKLQEITSVQQYECLVMVLVELPAADASVEAGSGAGAWQHGGDEDGRADAAHRQLHRRAHQGGS